MKKSDLIFIFKTFVSWRILLLIFLFFAIKFIPLQKDFLGGGMVSYLSNPYLWAWSNFDGEHYLAIAREGYLPLTYFFFPFYPILIKFFSAPFGKSVLDYLISGLFISHISIFLGMIGFHKLIRLDYKEGVAKLSLILILLFPTSFYFGSIYTESLFFALAIWSFYFARKKRWLAAGILGAFATATRIVGLALTAGLLVEWFQQTQKDNNRLENLFSLVFVLLSLSGIGIYLYYLYVRTGSPFNFLTTVGIFGPQRSASFVLIPQVFYRYIFKILPSLNYSNFFNYFSPWLEFSIAVTFALSAIYSFFKLRLSYSIYFLLGFLIPTFSGSFSSLPRYVLVLFPAFILGGIYLSRLGKWRYLALLFLATGLFFCAAFFTRGYWIS